MPYNTEIIEAFIGGSCTTKFPYAKQALSDKVANTLYSMALPEDS